MKSHICVGTNIITKSLWSDRNISQCWYQHHYKIFMVRWKYFTMLISTSLQNLYGQTEIYHNVGINIITTSLWSDGNISQCWYQHLYKIFMVRWKYFTMLVSTTSQSLCGLTEIYDNVGINIITKSLWSDGSISQCWYQQHHKVFVV